MLKMMRNQEGFTLLELLIVMVIIAILVAAAVPAFTSRVNAAKTTTCISNLRMLEDNAAAYNADLNSWPTEAQLVSGGYIKRSVSCPSGNASSTYTITSGNPVCPVNPTDHHL
jgi:prepilin-type N-terminal cleavage/methylation domain-containing protein